MFKIMLPVFLIMALFLTGCGPKEDEITQKNPEGTVKKYFTGMMDKDLEMVLETYPKEFRSNGSLSDDNGKEFSSAKEMRELTKSLMETVDLVDYSINQVDYQGEDKARVFFTATIIKHLPPNEEKGEEKETKTDSDIIYLLRDEDGLWYFEPYPGN